MKCNLNPTNYINSKHYSTCDVECGWNTHTHETNAAHNFTHTGKVTSTKPMAHNFTHTGKVIRVQRRKGGC